MLRGDRDVVAIPTSDDLALVLVGCPVAQAPWISYQLAYTGAGWFGERNSLSATNWNTFDQPGVAVRVTALR
jgi:hypothetical protein